MKKILTLVPLLLSFSASANVEFTDTTIAIPEEELIVYKNVEMSPSGTLMVVHAKSHGTPFVAGISVMDCVTKKGEAAISTSGPVEMTPWNINENDVIRFIAIYACHKTFGIDISKD